MVFVKEKSRSILLALMLLACLSATVAISPKAAHASSNGQQIWFSCPSMTYAAVKGYNQYGSYVMWQGYPSSGHIFTQGWWWAGFARIHWYSGGSWHSIDVSVPRQYYQDVVYYSCPMA